MRSFGGGDEERADWYLAWHGGFPFVDPRALTHLYRLYRLYRQSLRLPVPLPQPAYKAAVDALRVALAAGE